MLAKNRIYRTEDGRLVNESDPGAAYLAYAKGDEILPEDAKGVPAEDPQADPDLNKVGPDTRVDVDRNTGARTLLPTDKALAEKKAGGRKAGDVVDEDGVDDTEAEEKRLADEKQRLAEDKAAGEKKGQAAANKAVAQSPNK